MGSVPWSPEAIPCHCGKSTSSRFQVHCRPMRVSFDSFANLSSERPVFNLSVKGPLAHRVAGPPPATFPGTGFSPDARTSIRQSSRKPGTTPRRRPVRLDENRQTAGSILLQTNPRSRRSSPRAIAGRSEKTRPRPAAKRELAWFQVRANREGTGGEGAWAIPELTVLG